MHLDRLVVMGKGNLMQTSIAWPWLSSRNNNVAQLCRVSASIVGLFAVSLSAPAAPLTGGFNIIGSVTVGASGLRRTD
jgi:hypothetical protein